MADKLPDLRWFQGRTEYLEKQNTPEPWVEQAYETEDEHISYQKKCGAQYRYVRQSAGNGHKTVHYEPPNCAPIAIASFNDSTFGQIAARQGFGPQPLKPGGFATLFRFLVGGCPAFVKKVAGWGPRVLQRLRVAMTTEDKLRILL